MKGGIIVTYTWYCICFSSINQVYSYTSPKIFIETDTDSTPETVNSYQVILRLRPAHLYSFEYDAQKQASPKHNLPHKLITPDYNFLNGNRNRFLIAIT